MLSVMELLLTVEQTAERLQLHPDTIRRQLTRGFLRGVKRGRQWRIPESALSETVTAAAPETPEARRARINAAIDAAQADFAHLREVFGGDPVAQLIAEKRADVKRAAERGL